MKTKAIKTFTAVITLGLEIGYSKELYKKGFFIQTLQEYQRHRIDEASIYLSASITECIIVLSGQEEKHIRLEFINYPKFPLEVEVFKNEIIKLGSHLLKKLQQNRSVIVFTDETIMLEIDEAIDPRI
ncbi:hypothetical protein AB3G33_02980 [Flavobacterium sp. WC2421]|uniref:hypothetical protein n=1 Tax=Flavobacterium sp. WC2421 TaxID=3234138 RepID=UPI003465280D